MIIPATGMLVESVDDLHALAAELAKQLTGGSVVALSGDLGAGKTTFVQGLARSLGIDRPLASPTFALHKQYQLPAGLVFHHYDWYRLEDTQAIRSVGVEDVLAQPGTITVIEWPERGWTLVPDGALKLTLEYVDPTTRRIFNHT